MLQLSSTAQLPVDAATAWSLFESDDFRQRLEAETGVAATVLDQKDEGSVQVTRLRYVTKTELPSMVAKLMGSKHLAYEQTNHFDLGAGTLKWKVELPGLGARVNVQGTTTIRDVAGGSERTVDGSIEVKVRLVGGQIEKLVGAGFGKSMDGAVDVVREMIRERGLA